MTLREKQSKFARLVPLLITQAFEMGYEVTLGEGWRSPEEAKRLAGLKKGIKRSLHCDRLAIDLNLFKDGKWLKTTENHHTLGVWWELQSGPDFTCCWGGRFGDGNHYSLSYDGRK